MTIPAVFPDSLEVLVFRTEARPTFVAAIELISPGNKDRQGHRRAFAAKCSSYLQQGIGLMIIDIVTNRQANLHNELVHLLEAGAQFLLPLEPLYATAYRPVHREDAAEIAVWPATLVVGRPLPHTPVAVGPSHLCRSILQRPIQRPVSVVVAQCDPHPAPRILAMPAPRASVYSAVAVTSPAHSSFWASCQAGAGSLQSTGWDRPCQWPFPDGAATDRLLHREPPK